MLKNLLLAYQLLGNQKKYLPFLIILFSSTAVLEMMSIALVLPIVSLFFQDSIHIGLGLLGQYSFSRQDLPLMSGVILLAFLFKNVGIFLIQSTCFLFGYRLQHSLRERILNHAMKLSYEEATSRKSSDFTQNLYAEVNRFTLGFVQESLQFFANVLILILLVILVTQLNRYVFLLLIIMTIFGIGFYYFSRKVTYSLGARGTAAQNKMLELLQQVSGMRKMTRLYRLEDFFIKQMNGISQEITRTGGLFYGLQLLPRLALEMLFLLVFVLIVLRLNTGAEFTAVELIPQLSVFALAGMRILPLISALITNVTSIKNSTISLYRISTELAGTEASDEKELSINEQVVLSDVSFHFKNSGEKVLRKINLQVKKGEKVAIVGKSGAGKSTLIDIIIGLLKPSEGAVVIDGQDVTNQHYRLQDLGFVPQQIYLFNTTIAENIYLGLPKAQKNKQRLYKAIAEAGLAEFVESLPAKEKTVVGEDGSFLSGGQKQRIAIARALYRGAQVLIFDEPTSSLDHHSEAIVMKTIAQLKKHTIIIITHREILTQVCDTAYILDRGTLQAKKISV